MLAQEVTPRGPGKKVRRSPRHANKASAPTQTGQHSSIHQTVPSESFQPSHILKRGEPDVVSNNAIPQSDSAPTVASPRPRAKPRGKKEAPIVNGPASENAKGRKSKNKLPQSKPVNAPPNQEERPPIAPQSKRTTTTPAPATRTPSKAYAGPKFHDSPAPSSLPPPMFLSRSVPNVNRTTSLRNMLANDTSDCSSEAEGSPSQRAASRWQGLNSREDSPMDFLFRADQEAKATKSRPNINQMMPNGGSPFGDRSMYSNGPGLQFPPTRYHVRHQSYNDGSNGEMFNLEMDVPSKQPNKGSPLGRAAEIEKPESVMSPEMMEEDRIARTLALKRLLNVPITQTPTTPPEDIQNFDPQNGSPTPNRRSELRASPRLSGNPPDFPKGLDSSSSSQRQAVMSALEKHIAEPNGSPAHRPTSSSLRNEMHVEGAAQPAKTRVPATPPLTRKSERPNIVPMKARASTPNGPNGTYPTAIAGNVNHSTRKTPHGTPNGVFNGNANNLKFMEDDLRRILKLDSY